jgi:hypothetical protein
MRPHSLALSPITYLDPYTSEINAVLQGYKYYPHRPSSEKLMLLSEGFPNGRIRFLSDPHEVMAYDCKSPTQTVNAEGAEMNGKGSIFESFDMADFGFDREHGAEWSFSIQRTFRFYRKLLEVVND